MAASFFDEAVESAAMSRAHQYEVVYSSDITIEDAHELSSLCVFYDRVFLPHVLEPEVDSITFSLSDTHQTFDGIKTLSKGHFPSREFKWIDARRWDATHQTLFDADVLARLDPPSSTLEDFDEDLFFDMEAEDQFLTLARMKNWEIEEDEDDALLTIRPGMVRHLYRDDLTLPPLHVCGYQPASREIVKFLEAQSVFSYALPKLRKLNEEQILLVREKVKDTREGFAMHLQKLSKGVEQRLNGKETISDIARFAKSVVETDLTPDYTEFRKQLSAERRGFWKTVLVGAGEILSIDAKPTTPKFWGELLKAVGVPLDTVQERKEELSNQRQAFQFIKSLEAFLTSS